MNDTTVTLILPPHQEPKRRRGRRRGGPPPAVKSPEYRRKFKALCKEKNELFGMLTKVTVAVIKAERKGRVPQDLLDDRAFCKECYDEKVAELRELRGGIFP